MTEQAPQPQGMSLRLVSPGEKFGVTGNPLDKTSEAYFNTQKIRVPDFGDLSLVGYRHIGERIHPRIGLTIKDGEVITADAKEMEESNPDLFYITLKIEPGMSEIRNYAHVCQMRIDGIEQGFQAIIDSAYVDTEESYASTSTSWQSLNPKDKNKYEIMVSPKDSALLCSLSFSFVLRRVETD